MPAANATIRIDADGTISGNAPHDSLPADAGSAFWRLPATTSMSGRHSRGDYWRGGPTTSMLCSVSSALSVFSSASFHRMK
jgi:hypothetical protein